MVSRRRSPASSIDLTLFKPYDNPTSPVLLLYTYMMCRIIRAYALGYLSSTGPRLLGALRFLRRKDKTTEEKLNLVKPSEPQFYPIAFHAITCHFPFELTKLRLRQK